MIRSTSRMGGSCGQTASGDLCHTQSRTRHANARATAAPTAKPRRHWLLRNRAMRSRDQLAGIFVLGSCEIQIQIQIQIQIWSVSSTIVAPFITMIRSETYWAATSACVTNCSDSRYPVADRRAGSETEPAAGHHVPKPDHYRPAFRCAEGFRGMGNMHCVSAEARKGVRHRTGNAALATFGQGRDRSCMRSGRAATICGKMAIRAKANIDRKKRDRMRHHPWLLIPRLVHADDGSGARDPSRCFAAGGGTGEGGLAMIPPSRPYEAQPGRGGAPGLGCLELVRPCKWWCAPHRHSGASHRPAPRNRDGFPSASPGRSRNS